MRTTSFAKVAALCGLLALSGCASKITQPDKYSGFLNNYSDLKETTSATGKPVLRWVDTVMACKFFPGPVSRIAGMPDTAPSGAVFFIPSAIFTPLPDLVCY
ncbi:hypothetical protein AUS41_12310, partial [Escherichia coli]